MLCVQEDTSLVGFSKRCEEGGAFCVEESGGNQSMGTLSFWLLLV